MTPEPHINIVEQRRQHKAAMERRKRMFSGQVPRRAARPVVGDEDAGAHVSVWRAYQAIPRLFEAEAEAESEEVAEVAMRLSTARRISVSQIVGVVSNYFNISIIDLVSDRRTLDVLYPRQVAMYLCRTITARSLPAIGQYFGRDHTTVQHGVRKIARLIEESPKTAQHIEDLKGHFTPGVSDGEA